MFLALVKTFNWLKTSAEELEAQEDLNLCQVHLWFVWGRTLGSKHRSPISLAQTTADVVINSHPMFVHWGQEPEELAIIWTQRY